jgi:hypothetical protein
MVCLYFYFDEMFILWVCCRGVWGVCVMFDVVF